jgi:hypothetical protein
MSHKSCVYQPKHSRRWGCGLLRQSRGFEGAVAIAEVLPSDELALLEGEDSSDWNVSLNRAPSPADVDRAKDQDPIAEVAHLAKVWLSASMPSWNRRMFSCDIAYSRGPTASRASSSVRKLSTRASFPALTKNAE